METRRSLDYSERESDVTSPHQAEPKKLTLDNRTKLIQERREQEKQRLLSELQMSERKAEMARRTQEAEKMRRAEEAREREKRRSCAVAERRRQLDDLKKAARVSERVDVGSSGEAKNCAGTPTTAGGDGGSRHKMPAQRPPSSSYAFGSSTPRGLTFLGLLNENAANNKQSSATSKRSIESMEIGCTSAIFRKSISSRNPMTQSMYVPTTMPKIRLQTATQKLKTADANLTTGFAMTTSVRMKPQLKGKIAEHTTPKLSQAVKNERPLSTSTAAPKFSRPTTTRPMSASAGKPPRQPAGIKATKEIVKPEDVITAKLSDSTKIKINFIENGVKTEFFSEPLRMLSTTDENSTDGTAQISTDPATSNLEISDPPNVAVSETPKISFGVPPKPASPELSNFVESVDQSTDVTKMSKVLTQEEAKAALAERRRFAREQVEREKELERQREEAQRFAEEEEFRRQEEEELRLSREAKSAEDERMRQTLEELRLKKVEEERKADEDKQKIIENDLKCKELTEKADKEREEKMKRDEIDRSERKKKLESIRRRTRMPLNGDSASVVDSMTSSSSGNLTALDVGVVSDDCVQLSSATVTVADANGNVNAVIGEVEDASAAMSSDYFDVNKLLLRVRSKLTNGDATVKSSYERKDDDDVAMTSSILHKNNGFTHVGSNDVISSMTSSQAYAYSHNTAASYPTVSHSSSGPTVDDDVVNANVLNRTDGEVCTQDYMDNLKFSETEKMYSSDLMSANFSPGQQGENMKENDPLGISKNEPIKF